jgi:hypothetical protein
MELPKHQFKGKERRRFPSHTILKEFACLAEALCDFKAAVLMMMAGRKATAEGGDSVFDNYVGMLVDGASSHGKAFFGSHWRLGEFGQVPAPLVEIRKQTSLAKAQLIEQNNLRLVRIAAALLERGIMYAPTPPPHRSCH